MTVSSQLHGLEGLSHYLDDLLEKLDEVHKADRARLGLARGAT
jgi:hypothetical protein